MIAKAMAKLQNELKDNKDGGVAKVAEYLFGVINSDAGFAEDACDTKHNIKGCWEYITEQARKKATSGSYCAEDSEVYEWAEDYYRHPVPEVKKPAPKAKTKKTSNIIPMPKPADLVKHYQQEDLFSLIADDPVGVNNEAQDSIWDL